jgi:4,5-dihydroxyphthalate decarboxylase
MAELELTLACWNYDRTAALADGSIKPEGIRLRCLNVFPAETFLRMVKFREFEVSELGLKFYVSSLAMKEPPFIAIPVFPLRIFRHSAIFINANSGIQSPRDLIGKKVGEPFAYGHDAAIWARGILSDEYGVPAASAPYYVGAVDGATRREFAPFPPSADIKVIALAPDQTLDAMIESGEIDAMYSAIAPPSFLKGSSNVRRLFPNHEEVERGYFRKTGIFPIMHTVVIRRDVYRDNPWIAQSLYKAFKAAKEKCYASYRFGEQYSNALQGIPWLTSHLEQNRALMGDDPWSYGLEPNRKVIETFLRYHHEQGLSSRQLRAEDLFAPETLTDYSSFG